MAKKSPAQTPPPARRRTRLALPAALAGLVIVLIAAAWLACNWNAAVTAATLADARANPAALRAFLYRMPKGGDLHVHLTGGIYAERFIAWAVADRLCVQTSDYSIAKKPCDKFAGTLPMDEAVGAVDTQAKQQVYDRIVDALSMRNFRPSAAEPTGHDHFFAAFGKFSAAADNHFEDMVVDLLASYGAQSTQYLELMTSFSWTEERKPYVATLSGKTDPKDKLEALVQAGLANLVEKKKQELARSIIKIEELRGCGAEKTKPGCNVSYRFIAQVSRNASLDDVFVQTAIAAALVRSEPMVVAFNYVQAEDAAVPRADYSEQMRIVAYLAGSPAGEKRVNVSLHAGELWLGLVPPADLTFHIGEAVEIAHAQRIGHGVDLAFERDQGKLLTEYSGGKELLLPAKKFRDFTPPPTTLSRTTGHYREWIDACKTGKPTSCNFDFGSRMVKIAQLGAMAARAARLLEWDAAAERVTNDAEANSWVNPPYRKGWTL